MPIATFDCHYCGAHENLGQKADSELPALAKWWLEKHKGCANGETARVRFAGLKKDGTVEVPVDVRMRTK